MNARMTEELALLRQHYEKVEYSTDNAMHWFRVQSLNTPDEPGQWSPPRIPVVFAVTEGYPGIPPYGFFVPGGLNLNGKPPSESSAPHQLPFEGEWRFLSWASESWCATADVQSGSNLWGYVRTFIHRLREGV